MTYTDRRPTYPREQPGHQTRPNPAGNRARVQYLALGLMAVTGTPADVAQVIEQNRQLGRVRSVSEMLPLGQLGEVVVNVRLSPEPVQQAYAVQTQRRGAPVRQPMRRPLFWSLIGIGLAVLGGLAYGIVAAVNAIAANPRPVIAAAVIAVIVVGFLGGAGARSGGKTFSGTFRGKVH